MFFIFKWSRLFLQFQQNIGPYQTKVNWCCLVCMDNNDNILEVNGLSKSFGDFQALNGLNMEVKKGEIFGFLGSNGAGKSTTIRCILGLISADAGTVRFMGQDFQPGSNAFLQKVGCIIEKPDFYTHLSAWTNLKISARMYGMKPGNETLQGVIDLVGLKGREKDKVKTFSQGMKQRLGIAQALIHSPELIVLDEPTNGLDPKGMIDLRNILLRLKNDYGKTVIVSSHILSEIEQIADRFCIIDRGKTIAQGSTEEWLSEKDLLLTIESEKASDISELLSKSGWETNFTEENPNVLTVQTSRSDIPEIHRRIAESKLPIYGIYPRKKLEDLFLQLTENTGNYA